MRVTYDSKNTKRIVVKAAKNADLWGHRKKNGKIIPFFRDVIDTGRKIQAKSSQVKRKRDDGAGDKPHKNSKKSQTEITHIPDTASENLESEEVLEEERRQEFIANELMKEKLEDKNKKALKRREQANEAEITDFLREQRNKSSHEGENATGQENAEDTGEEEVELKYFRKINGGETSPNPTHHEVRDGYVVQEEVTIIHETKTVD